MGDVWFQNFRTKHRRLLGRSCSRRAQKLQTRHKARSTGASRNGCLVDTDRASRGYRTGLLHFEKKSCYFGSGAGPVPVLLEVEDSLGRAARQV